MHVFIYIYIYTHTHIGGVFGWQRSRGDGRSKAQISPLRIAANIWPSRRITCFQAQDRVHWSQNLSFPKNGWFGAHLVILWRLPIYPYKNQGFKSPNQQWREAESPLFGSRELALNVTVGIDVHLALLKGLPNLNVWPKDRKHSPSGLSQIRITFRNPDNQGLTIWYLGLLGVAVRGRQKENRESCFGSPYFETNPFAA